MGALATFEKLLNDTIATGGGSKELNQKRVDLFKNEVLPKLLKLGANKSTIQQAANVWNDRTQNMLMQAGMAPTQEQLDDADGAGSAAMLIARGRRREEQRLAASAKKSGAGQALDAAAHGLGAVVNRLQGGLQSGIAGTAGLLNGWVNKDANGVIDRNTALGRLEREARVLADESRRRGGAGLADHNTGTFAGDLWANTQDMSGSLAESSPSMLLGGVAGKGAQLGLYALGMGKTAQLVGAGLAAGATEVPMNYEDAHSSQVADLNAVKRDGSYIIPNTALAAHVPVFNLVKQTELAKGVSEEDAEASARIAAVDQASHDSSVKGALMASVFSVIAPSAGSLAAARAVERQAAGRQMGRLGNYLANSARLGDNALTETRAAQAVAGQRYTGLGLSQLKPYGKLAVKEGTEEAAQQLGMNYFNEDKRAEVSGQAFRPGTLTKDLASSFVAGAVMGPTMGVATQGTQQMQDARQIREMAKQSEQLNAQIQREQARATAFDNQTMSQNWTPEQLAARQEQSQESAERLQKLGDALNQHVSTMRDLGLNPDGTLFRPTTRDQQQGVSAFQDAVASINPVTPDAVPGTATPFNPTSSDTDAAFTQSATNLPTTVPSPTAPRAGTQYPEAPPQTGLTGIANRAAASAESAIADPASVMPETIAPEAAIPEAAPTLLPDAPKGSAIEEVPLDQIHPSEDVPQFKSGANAEGVVEPLGGKFDRTGVAPIQLWRRTNGRLEVISGRHRLDLARRSGETTIPSQIHNEADGFTANHAGILDAEHNIRDGQGKVQDYVDYFKHTGLSQETAESRGLLARATGQRAYSIATRGTDALIAGLRAGILSEKTATEIAEAAPNNEGLQAVGIKAVQDGKSGALAVNLIHAVNAARQDKAPDDTTSDLFGFDDSAMRELEQMARYAGQRQQDISANLNAIRGAAKNPALAKKHGVDVNDPDGLNKKIAELTREKSRWAEWHKHPDLMAQVRGMVGQTGTQAPAPAPAPVTKQGLTQPESPAKMDVAPDGAAEQAIRDAFEALPHVTLGEFYPITVQHNGRKQQFLASQRAIERNNQPRAALTLLQIRKGRFIAGDDLQYITHIYKLSGKNELTEVNVKPASDELIKRWNEAFLPAAEQVNPEVQQAPAKTEADGRLTTETAANLYAEQDTPDAGPDMFDLSPHSEQDVKDREDAQAAAKQKKEQEAERQKAQDDANDFVLTGSDRKVDQLEARGQGSLLDFGGNAIDATPTPTPTENSVLDGDILTASGKPFANRNAANLQLHKRGLKDSHDIVKVGKGEQYVIRAKESQRDANAGNRPPQQDAPVKGPNPESTPQSGTTASDYGANNTLVSRERYEELKAQMRAKLSGTQLNMGIDPEILTIGIQMTIFHLESGTRKFSEYVKAMVADMGNGVTQYLLSFWEGARHYPGLDTEGMSSPEDSRKIFNEMFESEDIQTEAVGQTDEPFEHVGLKISPYRHRAGGEIKDGWIVQTPENAEREARGERKIGGDRILDSREAAIRAAEQMASLYQETKAFMARFAQEEQEAKAAEEARKESNRGKTLAERRADAVLDKPTNLPRSLGLGAGTRREAMQRAVEEGRLILEVMVQDTAAKKRDEAAVSRVHASDYMLGLSNPNIPIVKAGLEAQARLKENKYEKPEYRVYAGQSKDDNFVEISKTEYDYALRLKGDIQHSKQPATDAPAQTEAVKRAERRMANLRKQASGRKLTPGQRQRLEEKIKQAQQEKEAAESKPKSAASPDDVGSQWDALSTEEQRLLVRGRFSYDAAGAVAGKKWGELSASGQKTVADAVDTATLLVRALTSGVVSPVEYPTAEAEKSFEHISQSPKSGAYAVRNAFLEAVQREYEAAAPLAETQKQKDALASAIDEFKTQYLRHDADVMAARSNSYSGMVAGRDKLNNKQVAQRGNALDRQQDALQKWLNGATGSVKRAVIAARSPEQWAAEKQAIADNAAKILAQKEELIAKLLDFKTGDTVKFGGLNVTRVSKGRDGYPSSVFVDGIGLTDNKFDLAKTLFDGDTAKLREVVDAVRAKQNAAPDAKVTEQPVNPLTQPAVAQESSGQKYTGPADVLTRDGQMELANRAGTIAALKGMNAQLRAIAPEEAWADANIEEAMDLDALRTAISEALVKAQRVDQANPSGRYAEDSPILTPAEAKELLEWQNMGQSDGVKTHRLFFYESKANKDAKTGRKEYGTVESYQGGKWSIDDRTYSSLSAAKTAAVELAIARLKVDGFVKMTEVENATPAPTKESATTAQKPVAKSPAKGAADSGIRFSRRAGGEAEARRQFAETEQTYGGQAAYERAKAAGQTKLGYRQWIQVRTPNFKAWFGDWENDPANASKVVDPDTGEPMVVYHGTDADFHTFKSSGKNGTSLGDGFYFSSDKRKAENYAKNNGKVMGLFLKASKPAVYKLIPENQKQAFLNSSDPYQELGLDSYWTDGFFEVVVKEPNQIKSATDNTGEFSADNPDIRHSRPAQEPTGLSVAQVRESIIKKIGKAALEALEKAGRLEIIQTFDPVKMAGNVMRSVMAWHGSPFTFDKFSLSHLGRGEGNQAYGWGLYFAGNREVAEYYKNALAQDRRVVLDGHTVWATGDTALRLNASGEALSAAEQLAAEAILRFNNAKEAITFIDGRSSAVGGPSPAEKAAAIAMLESGKMSISHSGKLYRVQVPADDTFLQWDKPLSEQSDAVQKALQDKRVAAALAKHKSRYRALFAYLGDAGFTGHEIYTALSETFGSDKAASQYLHKIGISGIKYLDGTSRAAGEGNHNYVVFDDNAVRILETYYSRVSEQPEGFYDPATGKATLVADGLTEETIIPTLLHELSGHAGFQGMMKPETYQAILAQVERMVASGNPIALRAQQRAAVESDDQTRKDELLPYLITEAQAQAQKRSPALQAVQRLIDRVIRAIKVWAAERGFGPAIRRLTPDDIRVMAEQMLDRMVKAEGQKAGEQKAGQQFSQLANTYLFDRSARTLGETYKKGETQHGNNSENGGSDRLQDGPENSATEISRRNASSAVDDLRSSKTVSGQRMSSDYDARQRTSLVGQQIKNPADLAILAQVYRDPRFETFRIFFVDKSRRVVAQMGLTSRLPTSAVAIIGDDTLGYLHQLADTAAQEGATGYYMLHNHPNGFATASEADKQITRTFTYGMLGLENHGHVVIDTNECSLISERGDATLHRMDFGAIPPPTYSEWSARKLLDPVDVMYMVKQLEVDTDAVTIINLNSDLRVQGITTVPSSAFSQKGDAAKNRRALLRAALPQNGVRQVLVGHNRQLLESMAEFAVELVHILPDGTVEPLYGKVPGINDSLFKTEIMRKGRVTPDTSPAFDYLRNVALVAHKNAQALQAGVKANIADYATPDQQFADTEKAYGGRDIRYSRRQGPQPFAELPEGRLYHAAQAAGRALSRLNTQFHLALQNPRFARVFNLIQAKLNHVVSETYACVQAAPDLLGRHDSFGDYLKLWSNVLHYKRNAQDHAAAAKALFDGTLIDQMVYTDQELRDIHQLSDTQIGLYRQARAAIDISLDQTVRGTILKIGLNAGMPFERVQALLDQDISYQDAQDEVIRYLEDRVADATAELRNLQQIGASPMEISKAQKKEQQLELSLEESRKRIGEIIKQRQYMAQTGYAPLMRFGNYWVNAYDDKGELAGHWRFESKRERDQAYNAMGREGVQVSTGEDNPDSYKLYQGVSPETVALFMQKSGLPLTDVEQEYFKLATANHSALRRKIHRKGYAGYSEDLSRVLSAFVLSNARYTVNQLYGSGSTGEIHAAVADTESTGGWQQRAQKLANYADDTQEELSWWRNVMFHINMGFSIGFGLVNLTQPFTQTLPFLTQERGGGAVKDLSYGLKVAMTSLAGKALPSQYQPLYLRAQKEGHLDPANVWQLQGRERGRSGVSHNFLSALSGASGAIAQVSETVNRRATFFAALKATESMTPEQIAQYGSAYDYAVRAVQETQGIYNKGNRPMLSRGNVGSLFMMFKQYSIAYVEQLWRHFKHPKWRGEKDPFRRAFLLMLGMLWSIAGTMGLPFAQNIADMAQLVGAPLHGVHPERWLRDHLGRGLSDAIQYGPLNAFGLTDISGRTSMGNLVPGTKLLDPATYADGNLNAALDAAGTIGGPVGGFVSNIGKGLIALSSGDTKGVVTAVSPRAVGDAIKGVSAGITGDFKTGSRKTSITDVTPLEAAAKTLGLQPRRFTAAQRDQGELYQQITSQRRAESRFKNRYKEALQAHDAEEMRAIAKEIRQWNAENPELRVEFKRADVIRAIREDRKPTLERMRAPKEIRKSAEYWRQ